MALLQAWVCVSACVACKCANCAVAEFQNILCGGKKNKTRSVGLSCRQKVCLLVDMFSCRFDNCLSV